MSNDKICAIVVWYNPSIDNINITLNYSNIFSTVFVIDNSTVDNSNFFLQKRGYVYKSNNGNIGIAKALNIGLTLARNSGFMYALLMDQDSIWDDKELFNYITKVLSIDNKAIALYGPKVKRSDDNKYTLLKIFNSFTKQNNQKMYICDKLITSGSVININIWYENLGFLDKLFIDEVDFEYCFRVQCEGYKLVTLNSYVMNQTYGEVRKSFFPMTYSYHRERIYYLFRNKIYVMKRFHTYSKRNHYLMFLICVFLGKLLSFNFIDLRFAFQGIYDSYKNHFGKYKSI